MRTVDIAVPWEEIARRQARVEAAATFRYLDRVAAVPGIFSRFWLHRLGISWADYTSSPRRMLDVQVQAHKWVLEHVPGDVTGVGIHADLFSIYGESFGLGCELAFDALTPWIRTHPVSGDADLARLAAVDPADNRHTEAMRTWMAAMEPHLGDYRFRYADGVVRALPERLTFGGGTLGVFTLAADLRGPDIYLDLYERPEFARELLRIVTDKMIERCRWLRGMGIGVNSGTCLVDDSAGALSPRLYREFVVPCVLRALDALGRPLRIHIDAPANHLLPIYQELDLQDLIMFGWGTSLEQVRDTLGGRATLSGNLDPMLFASGTPRDIYDAAMHALEILAPCGGFVLMEGANMVPEAKLENIGAMVQAAEDFGLPEPRSGWGVSRAGSPGSAFRVRHGQCGRLV